MTESKDFRIGTRLLLWEKERLSMEYEDLQAKWTEIQQTKVHLFNYLIHNNFQLWENKLNLDSEKATT